MLTRREGTIRRAWQTPTPPVIPLKTLGINSPPECERTPSAALLPTLWNYLRTTRLPPGAPRQQLPACPQRHPHPHLRAGPRCAVPPAAPDRRTALPPAATGTAHLGTGTAPGFFRAARTPRKMTAAPPARPPTPQSLAPSNTPINGFYARCLLHLGSSRVTLSVREVVSEDVASGVPGVASAPPVFVLAGPNLRNHH